MNRTDSPKKQPVIFAVNGPREDLLDTTPSGDNTASYNSGFPPITMTIKSAGGKPPKGQDMNQILYELSAIARWYSAGALNTYDSAFATAVNGYPKGSVLVSNDNSVIYVNTFDGNSTDPNAAGAGWKNIVEYLQLSNSAGFVGRKIGEQWITTSGTYTPTPGTKRINVMIIGGGGGGGGGQANSAGYVSAGSGGGAGGASRKTIDVTSSFSVSVTIGSGGAAGIFSSSQPSDGGATSFGSYMTANGGGRGSNCGSVAFGVTQLVANGGGGVSSGGDINTNGGSGGPAIILGQGYTSGGGGNSAVAGGGQPIATNTSVNGIDGSYGSGGSGAYVLASGSEKNGGRGGAGVCIIEEYA